jgi:hypothetical protein
MSYSYAAFIHGPLRCGLAATALRQTPDSTRLIVEAQANLFEAKNVVIATGPFQVPVDHQADLLFVQTRRSNPEAAR